MFPRFVFRAATCAATILVLLAAEQHAVAQDTMTGPLEVDPALQPLDELLRQQWEIFFTERDKAWNLHNGPSQVYYEASRKSLPTTVHGEKLIDFAREHPGTPEALQCLCHIVETFEGGNVELSDPAWEELIAHEKDNVALVWLCDSCDNDWYIDVNERRLRKLFDTSSNPRVKASAAFNLAKLYDRATQTRRDLERHRANITKSGLLAAEPHVLDAISGRNVDELAAQRDQYLKLVKEAYATEKAYGVDRMQGRLNYRFRELENAPTFGELATGLEFELSHLRLGCRPPEIDAKDVAGNAFKLTDQLGKPVLLFFSFKGCGACEAFYPDLRALQAKYATRGLEVMAIMGDAEVDTVHQSIKDCTITWRCVWDGWDGPIATQYRVHSWPTIYLLDQEGRVVSRLRDREVLERELDRLLAVPEASPRK